MIKSPRYGQQSWLYNGNVLNISELYTEKWQRWYICTIKKKLYELPLLLEC